MAGIAGQGTTYNLPNFVGDLFAVTPRETPFLSMIGGLTGGKSAKATQFQWQGYDLRTPAANNVALEGANAPTSDERVRFNVTNVVEIHHEAVEVSYTKQSTPGQYGGANIAGTNPVQNELAFQVDAKLAEVARDVEWSFIRGAGGTLPADNSTPRKTQGLLAAVTSNVVDLSTLILAAATAAATTDLITAAGHGLNNGDSVIFRNITGSAPLAADTVYFVVNKSTNTFSVATVKGGAAIDITADGTLDLRKCNALSKANVDALMQSVFDNGGLALSETATLMVGSGQKLAVTGAYLTAGNYREQSRVVAGVDTQTIDTDFGVLNVMLNRHMPKGQLAVVSAEQCYPVFLEVPGKGFLFLEELAKTGSSDKFQLYGEIGLEYGNEKAHGKLIGCAE